MTAISTEPTIHAGKVSRHLILRETLRHYLSFRDLVAGTGQHGEGADGRKHVLEHSYWYKDENGEKKKDTVSISFWDLQRGISELAPRKREALFHNVILDKKQWEVAEIMGITTVSVGQYVRSACETLSLRYFDQEDE